jgi:hypothetical protein
VLLPEPPDVLPEPRSYPPAEDDPEPEPELSGGGGLDEDGALPDADPDGEE